MRFLTVIRVWSDKDNDTCSEEIAVNFGRVAYLHTKRYYDTVEEYWAEGTELVFDNGDRLLVGDSLDAIVNRLT